MFSASFQEEKKSVAPLILTATAVVATGVAVYWFYSSRGEVRVEGGLSKEKVTQVTNDLLMDFHSVFVEMSQMAVRVRQVLSMKAMSLSEEELVGLLMDQGIQAKLEQAQDAVLSRHGTSEEEVEAAQKKFCDDPVIGKLESGIDKMFVAAAKGDIPILPNFQPPEDLTIDLAIEIHQQLLDEKAAIFRRILGAHYLSNPSTGIPPPEISEALQLETEEVERRVIQERGIAHKALFDSASALFAVGDAQFAKERKRQERIHQAEVMKIMTGAPSAAAAPPLTVPGLHERLAPICEDTLPVLLMEATEEKAYLILALLKPTVKNHFQALKPLSDFAESNAQKAFYAYMTATENSLLEQNEKCKDAEAVFLIFASPERRPLACLNIEEVKDALSVS